MKQNGYFEYRRNEQAKYWMYETINEQLKNSFYRNEHIADSLKQAERDVQMGKMTSFVAANKLLDEYFGKLSK